MIHPTAVIDPSARLGNNVSIGPYSVIGADVEIGDDTWIGPHVVIEGTTRIGRYCLIGGGAGILGHLSIADRVTVTAMSLVTHSIHAAGEYSSGTPIQENRQWRRNAARFRHLDELARRV